MVRYAGIVFVTCALAAVTGCMSIEEREAQRPLDVKTVFVAPAALARVDTADHSVFVAVTNQSKYPEFVLEPLVRSALMAKGYRMVDDPTSASYVLRINVTRAGMSTKAETEKTFASTLGDAHSAGLKTGLAASALGAGATGTAVAGAGGVVAGLVLGAFTEPLYCLVVADVSLAQKVILPGGTEERRLGRSKMLTEAGRVGLVWKFVQGKVGVAMAKSIAGLF